MLCDLLSETYEKVSLLDVLSSAILESPPFRCREIQDLPLWLRWFFCLVCVVQKGKVVLVL